MDRKVFLAITLCVGIFLLWRNLYLKPYEEQQLAWTQQQQKLAQSQPSVPQAQPVAPKAPAQGTTVSAAKSAAPQTVSLGDESYRAVINTQGGVVTSVSLADYHGRKTDNVAALVGGAEKLELSSPTPEWTYLSSVVYSIASKGKNADGHEQVVLTFEDENVTLRRTYTLLPNLFSIDHDLTAQFKKQPPNYLYVGLKTAKTLSAEQLENERRQVVLNRAGGQDTYNVADIDELKEHSAQTNWAGISSRYFLNALASRGSDARPQFQARPIGDNLVGAGLFYKVNGPAIQIPVRMYYGPKDTDVLKQAGSQLEAAVDFGWFTIFAYPMLTALKWFYKYVHNFGIAIILLTVLVKLLTYPLTLKSMKSMKQMQRIQPQIQRLRERHKDNKEQLNREMLQLMRANGYNPMGGCLPIFIQMPIFIALYNVLNGAIDLYGQPFFGWIHDLSTKDPLYITPVLLSLMMFLQQKMTPTTAADPAQQRMMLIMPLIFGFMMLSLPSGLTLYMLVNSVVSVIQQVVINKTLNVSASSA